jgi:hypothetical protein
VLKYIKIFTIYTFLQLSSGLEENFVDCVSRPEFLGQRLHGYHSSGPVQAFLLQGKLFHVQENVAAKEERADEGL